MLRTNRKRRRKLRKAMQGKCAGIKMKKRARKETNKTKLGTKERDG